MDIHEHKYCFINQQQQMLLDWLEYYCVQDPDYYLGHISSLYYDTPTLNLYREKRNSDYLKSKVRLRWYSKLQELKRNQKVKCYLEVKRKYGALRIKKRLELNLSVKQLRNDPFADDEIMHLPLMVYQLSYFPQGILVPMLLIQYERYRFIDPQSGSRISLDTNICCKKSNTKFISGEPPIFLGVGVLEVKGKYREMPDFLAPIAHHLTKEAFSKYGRSYETLMQPFGRRI